MRVIQLRSYLNYGDGIGNTIIKFDEILSRYYSTIIAVLNCDSEYNNHPRVLKFKKIDELKIQSEDIIIFHFGGADALGLELAHVSCKKIFFYQNVTYPYFYSGININTMISCAEGQRYIRSVEGIFLKAIAPSVFSRNELIDVGWNEEDVYQIPLPISMEKKANSKRNRRKNRTFLFVGRVVPNKKIEDVICVFDYYRRHYHDKSVLKLVGTNYKDAYYLALKKYIEARKIENVNYYNHVSNEELDKLYRSSDIYLCMSEHEGFCIPLIEAMSYEIPVVAYNATAVPDTMGNAGVILNSKDPQYVCEKIDRIFEDESYRQELIECQNRHVDSYIRDDYEKRLCDIIEEVKSISSYSYDDSSIEFYRILLDEIEKSSKEYLQEQTQRLKDMGKPIVLYGAGTVGTMLLKYFEKDNLQIEAVCDAGKAGEEIEGKTILSPKEGAKKHPEAIYIITVQKPNIASEISDNLFELGVLRSNVYRYSNRDKKIVI